MPLIQTLPTEVIHLIAAGEVIDSLAAVVRELAENAIDAKATRLAISIWTDTLSLQVSDNGCGMDLADLKQAATPHTTSKIHDKQDLQQIDSLGFRGEALHSLAQLADLQICSRKHTDNAGWQVRYDHAGNLLGEPKNVAIALGTVVTVDRLFATLPSRLQVLPAIAQQVRKIQILIHQMAIANPQITWQVSLDDREWIAIWAGRNVRDILPQIISAIQFTDLATGSEIISEIVTESSSSLQAANSLSDQSAQYKTRTNSLDSHRQTSTAQIEVTLGLPDRLSRRRPEWVKIVVNGRMVTFPEMEQIVLSAFSHTLPRHRYPVCIVHLHIPPDRVDWNRHPAKNEVYLQNLSDWQAQVSKLISQVLHAPETDREVGNSAGARTLLRLAEGQKRYLTHSPTSEPSMRSVKALAQVHNTYILAEHAAGMWLIEQHVAHERVLFEEIEQQWQIVAIAPPIVLDRISPEGVERLQALEIEIEPFGDNLWVVRSLPAILVGQTDCAAILLELSQQPEPQGARATAACRSAIRNGTSMDLLEMQNLLDRWQQTRNPHTCPHGRPICLSLEESDLARFFRRNWIIGKN
ncbi:DNA mismatch repair endonuclease MutL [Tumidithrix elongata RA019]|uniref:DNA mismatch repair protein MutL n=1 Tax=Tumidithrix elongata BACA0141 TaxID=2716417 RepID=A0AAW9Q321_9CYAN|nr:DNA mismatch repair endonuclease MutL [Tumidithrix elongata RA019]